MIPAISKEKFKAEAPILDAIEIERRETYERLKIEIIKQARTHEEYEELNRKLLDRLEL